MVYLAQLVEKKPVKLNFKQIIENYILDVVLFYLKNFINKKVEN